MSIQDTGALKKTSMVMPRKISLNYTQKDDLSERVKREKELLFSTCSSRHPKAPD